MKTRIILLILAVVGSLVLAACLPISPWKIVSTDAPDSPLNGTRWLLESLNKPSVVPEARPTLNFEKATLNGTDGCNQYSGSYTVDGEKINVSKEIVTTMMACADPIMQQASAYLTALTQATTYSVTDQQLMLLAADGRTLATFTQQKQEVGGTAWTVTGYNNGRQAVVSVIAGSTLTLDFSADGKLSGSAGCNNYTATYEVAQKRIKIGPAASTRKWCTDPAGVMDQEAQFLQALETAATYHIDGDGLELRTADGALAVTCTRASSTEGPFTP